MRGPGLLVRGRGERGGGLVAVGRGRGRGVVPLWGRGSVLAALHQVGPLRERRAPLLVRAARKESRSVIRSCLYALLKG